MDRQENLTSVFWAHYRGAAGDGATGDLQSTLERLTTEGREAWPEVFLPSVTFVRHLAERMSPEGSVQQVLEKLHTADLYLACACAQQNPKALAAFDASYLRQTPRFIAHINSSPSFADEVTQCLREKTLVPSAEGSARIAEYAGLGTLLSWVRIAAVRMAIDLARKSRPPQKERELSAVEQILKANASPEMACISVQYRDLLNDAIRTALSSLTDEQRNLLRLYYLHGMSMEQIAGLFGVEHRATIKRRLDKLQDRLLEAIKGAVRNRLQLSSMEFRSLVNVLLSQLDLAGSAL